MQQLCVLAKIVPTPRVIHARMIYMRTYTAAWRTPTNDISPTYRPAEADSPASALPGGIFSLIFFHTYKRGFAVELAWVANLHPTFMVHQVAHTLINLWSEVRVPAAVTCGVMNAEKK